MKEFTVPAKKEELDRVLEFVEKELSECRCSARVQTQVLIAVEEIFINIANYAYHPMEGRATIKCSLTKEPLSVMIQFLDDGVPYNPLQKEDPDTTLSLTERQVGGLGIFMVKKSMDAVNYQYKDGKNILTIKKLVDQ